MNPFPVFQSSLRLAQGLSGSALLTALSRSWGLPNDLTKMDRISLRFYEFEGSTVADVLAIESTEMGGEAVQEM